MRMKVEEELIKNKYNGKEPYESIYRLNLGLSLDEYQAYSAMNSILKIKDKNKRSVLMTMLLNGLMVKDPTVSEVKGLLTASLEKDNILNMKKPKIKLPKNKVLIGLAGSGKKGIKTFNISTPAAIVAACNGAYIAKACSSSTSSKTGSSDFLSELGININKSFKEQEKILKETGVMFFSIEATTPKFAKLYEGVFYAPHAMSYALAALSFPIEVDNMVYGLSHPNIKLSIDVLKAFNFNNAFVYSSTEDGVHYLDELGISGYANVIGIQNGVIGKQVMSPIKDEFNLDRNYTNIDIAEGRNVKENVKKAALALQGKGSRANIDAICINASLLLCLSKQAGSLLEGYNIAYNSIVSGKCFEHFLKILELYDSNTDIINKICGEKNE